MAGPVCQSVATFATPDHGRQRQRVGTKCVAHCCYGHYISVLNIKPDSPIIEHFIGWPCLPQSVATFATPGHGRHRQRVGTTLKDFKNAKNEIHKIY